MRIERKNISFYGKYSIDTAVKFFKKRGYQHVKFLHIEMQDDLSLHMIFEVAQLGKDIQEGKVYIPEHHYKIMP